MTLRTTSASLFHVSPIRHSGPRRGRTLVFPRTPKYVAIFNFIDSHVDVGNLMVNGIPNYLAMAKMPYGQTYFGYPTWCCFDGRLVIDCIDTLACTS